MIKFVVGLPLVLTFGLVAPRTPTTQVLADLAGTWTIDRAVSVPGPGDPGSDTLSFDVSSATEVKVTRTFRGNDGGWVLPIDGTELQNPHVPGEHTATATVQGGQLIITLNDALSNPEPMRRIVTYVFTAMGDTLIVRRSISSIFDRPKPDSNFVHVMVYRKG
jgi:hypothetical protein